MTIWHTSDLHLGHENILGFADRPWDTLDEMHKGIRERWNYHVEPNDTVFIEGDVAMAQRDQTVPLIAGFNGNKILVPGNHDNSWPGGHKHWREKWLPFYEQYMEVIAFLPPQLSHPHLLMVGSATLDVQLAHFPRVGDSRHDERYTAWRPPFTDEWLLHGHTHSKEKIDRTNLQFHVGMDAWDYTPVAEQTIYDLIQQG